jgi:hypothetical protein
MRYYVTDDDKATVFRVDDFGRFDYMVGGGWIHATGNLRDFFSRKIAGGDAWPTHHPTCPEPWGHDGDCDSEAPRG